MSMQLTRIVVMVKQVGWGNTEEGTQSNWEEKIWKNMFTQ